MRWRWIVAFVVIAVLVLPLGYFGSENVRSLVPAALVRKGAALFLRPEQLDQLLPAVLPESREIKAAYWLEQGWSQTERFWFHHASQGTSTLAVPYEWFVALEQPGLTYVGDSALLKDPDYLRQFGFLPSPRTLNTSPATLERYGYRGGRTPESAENRTSTSFTDRLARRPPENVDGLPVGFARTPGYVDPVTGELLPDQLGFTCAACHTGQIEYKGISLRFDGGSALINLPEFQKAIGQALYYTSLIPYRFDRFARRVLGLKHTPEEYKELKERFERFLTVGGALKKREYELLAERRAAAENALRKAGSKESLKPQDFEHIEEGFGRLDALNRIGNQVFYRNFLWADPVAQRGTEASKALGFNVEDNFARLYAPVSFPPLWDTPWFLWAQYDGSILQPMIRNAGEALGVGAKINLISPGEDLFRSSLDIEDLHNIERQLAGDSHPLDRAPPRFAGLRPPKWPDTYFPGDERWSIRPEKVAEGRKLYAELCVECHREPVSDPEFRSRSDPPTDFWSPKNWKSFGASRLYLDVVQKPAADMKTDPALAAVMSERTVELPGFIKIDPAKDLERWGCPAFPDQPKGTLFALALMVVVDRSVARWLDRHPELADKGEDWLGDRPNCPNMRFKHYRARPLDGIWATPPYLHNGSVPNLWALLSPRPDAERPRLFCLGEREYDPVKVGYVVTEDCKGTTLLDTAVAGNGNHGHEFTAEPGTPMEDYEGGQIGRKLSDSEREALIEYLKTL
jgi:hypothetical protein